MENKKSYMEPFGLWKVTTEGDCEGRTIRQLGIYKGNYYDIALALADKCCYALTFEKLDEMKFYLPKTISKDSVDIRFFDCRLSDSAELVKDMTKFVKDDNFELHPGPHNGIVTIVHPRSEEEKLADIKHKALQKLTLEERKALGLE